MVPLGAAVTDGGAAVELVVTVLAGVENADDAGDAAVTMIGMD